MIRWSIFAASFGFAIAFILMRLSNVHPGHSPVAALVALSVVSALGYVIVPWAGKRCRLSDAGQRDALTIYAAFLLAGLVVPVSIVCVHARLFEWLMEGGDAKNKIVFPRLLAAAIERTAWGVYGGALVLVIVTKVLQARWRTAPRTTWRGSLNTLRWAVPEYLLLAMLLLVGVQAGALWYPLREPIQWVGLVSLAVLTTFWFRGLRRRRSELNAEIPPELASTKILNHFLLVLALIGLSIPVVQYLFYEGYDNWRGDWYSLGLVLPWIILECVSKHRPAVSNPARAEILRSYAAQHGVWAAISHTLVIGGLVLTGIAKGAFSKAPELGFPFFQFILVLGPFYSIAVLPGLLGGFAPLIVVGFPRTAKLADRIPALVWGGTIWGALWFFGLALYALALAIVSVACITKNAPPPAELYLWVGQGRWEDLSWRFILCLVGCAAAGGAWWACLGTIRYGCAKLASRKSSPAI